MKNLKPYDKLNEYSESQQMQMYDAMTKEMLVAIRKVMWKYVDKLPAQTVRTCVEQSAQTALRGDTKKQGK